MKLIIAEKSSVGMDIANALGIQDKAKGKGYVSSDLYIVTWCVGHLVTLKEPNDYDEKYKNWNIKDLPIIPIDFKLKVISRTFSQFKIVKGLLNDPKVNSIIVATDAGREGELIFRHVYTMSGCKKPFERLWISSFTKESVKKGFNNLIKGTDKNYLYDSAFARQKADWLIGMNTTRLFSKMYNETLRIGRVQTPTLNMIVEREKEISCFNKSYYYKVHADNGNIEVIYEDQLEDLDIANDIKERTDTQVGKVKDLIIEDKSLNAPKLFDLGALQKECNKRFGFSASKTLEIAQSLYESKLALLSYPRTDSRYITSEDETTVLNLFNTIILKFDEYKSVDFMPNVKVLINDKMVSDHTAIIPTENIFTNKIQETSSDQKKILDLVIKRTITSMAPKHTFKVAKLIVDVKGFEFIATANKPVDLGFKKIDSFEDDKDVKESKNNDLLFNLKVNQDLGTFRTFTSEHETKPKKRYTDATIITAMETAGKKDFKEIEDIERIGIGTPASRANIITSLEDTKYIERKGKYLIPTAKGMKLIELVPESLKSVDTTVTWEKKLSLIKKGQESQFDFINEIGLYLKKLINTTNVNEKITFNNKKEKEVVGKCPQCGKDLIKKTGKFGTFIACSNYPECRYIESKKKDNKETGNICPKCGKPLVLRNGKFGKFEACSNYPECQYIEKKNSEVKTNEVCPKCGKPVIEKIGKYGKFKACSDYPNCKTIIK